MRRSITVAVGVLLFCAVVIHLDAATITVTNTNDSGFGSRLSFMSTVVTELAHSHSMVPGGFDVMS